MFFLLSLSLPYVNWSSQEGCLFHLRFLLQSQPFLCSVFTGFSLLYLLATAILDSFFHILTYSNYVTLCDLKYFSQPRAGGGFPGGSAVKDLPAMQETQIHFLDQEDPLEEDLQPTPVFLPRESHGQRSLAGCSPQGHTESDMTEAT